jgi:hypothetical protein
VISTGYACRAAVDPWTPPHGPPVASRVAPVAITEPVFAFLARNARSVTDDFSIPVEQVVELGMQLDR